MAAARAHWLSAGGTAGLINPRSAGAAAPAAGDGSCGRGRGRRARPRAARSDPGHRCRGAGQHPAQPQPRGAGLGQPSPSCGVPIEVPCWEQRAEHPLLLSGHPHPRPVLPLPSYSPTGATTPPMWPLGCGMLWGGGEEAPRRQGDPTPAQPVSPVGCSHGPLQLLVLDGAVQRLRREKRGQSASGARLRGAARSRGSTEGFGNPRPICLRCSPSFLASALPTAWPVCTHQLAGIVSGLTATFSRAPAAPGTTGAPCRVTAQAASPPA